jgi:hypothetical protein
VTDIGDIYPASLNVYDANGVLTTPATYSLTIALPDGTTQNPAVTVASVGVLSALYLTTQAGRHVLSWVTTGPNTAYTDVFDVTPQPPIGLVSLADAKRQLGIDPSYADDDDELRSWIAAMTGPVELHKNEVVVQRQFTHTWEQRRSGWKFRLFKLPVVQLISLTGIIWGTTTTYVSAPIAAGDTSGTYYIDPDTGIGRQILQGPSLAGYMTATWTAGYSVIPQHYQNAAMMLLQALWETRRGPGGVGGVIGPEELADYRHYEALPRKVRELLGPARPVVLLCRRGARGSRTSPVPSRSCWRSSRHR